MQFNPNHKPSREKLDAMTAAIMDRAFYRNRANGFNVQFNSIANGMLDEWSFNSAENRDAFIRTLVREGVSYAISKAA